MPAGEANPPYVWVFGCIEIALLRKTNEQVGTDTDGHGKTDRTCEPAGKSRPNQPRASRGVSGIHFLTLQPSADRDKGFLIL